LELEDVCELVERDPVEEAVPVDVEVAGSALATNTSRGVTSGWSSPSSYWPSTRCET
jgi:hypothetical protein